MTFVQGREYYLGLTDVENDYYYNARVILDSGVPSRLTHPGTPVYYLGALVLAIVGEGQDRTQAFFNTMYVLGLFALAGAMLFFARAALKGVGFAISLAVLSTVAIWPPTLTDLNYFGPDTFMLPATLVVLGYFWKLLGSSKISNRQLASLGVLIGVTLAIKTNFLLMAVPIGGALTVHFLRSSSGVMWLTRLREVVSRLGFFGGFVLVSGAVAISPLLLRSHVLIYKIRQEAAGGGPADPGLPEQIGKFFDGAPLFFLALLVVAILAAVAGGLWLKASGPRESLKWPAPKPGEPDHVALVVFLGLAGSLLLYAIFRQIGPITLFEGKYENDFGIAIRQLTPVAMILPLALLGLRDFWRRQRELPTLIASHSSALGRVIAIVAVLAMAWTFLDYGSSRSDSLDELRTDLNIRTESIDNLFAQGRVAIYDSGILFGEPAFHYWGNYKYAYDRFDDEILAAFPRFTQLHLREAKLLDEAQILGLTGMSIHALNAVRNPRTYSSNPAKRLFQTWQDRFTEPDRSTEIVAGESTGETAAVIQVVSKSIQSGDIAGPLRLLLPIRLGLLDIECARLQSPECLESAGRPLTVAVGDETWVVYSFGRWALSD